ncbi:MAG: hypothetical protein Q9M18_09255 [Mariprofundaceae bacterium]|nr:hypothetical protein [Mariprofundaceae bacterium]
MKNVFIRTAALMLATTFAAPAFAGDIKFGGKIYADMTQKSVTSAGVKTTTRGANLTRSYFSAKTDLDDTWSVAFKVDVSAETGLKKNNQIFLKQAQLTGHFMPEFNAKLGVIGTAWVGHEEHLFGHRYISKSFVDTQGLDSSADAGLGVFGKVADGMFNYEVAVINGKGYGDTASTGAQDINARFGINVSGLTVDLGLRSGYMGTKTTTATTTGTKYVLTQLMVSYGMGHDFRVGANIVSDKATPATGAAGKLTGLDIFAQAKFTDQLGAFATYQTAKLDAAGAILGAAKKFGKMTGAATEKRTVVSVDYKVQKKVLVSLALTNVKDLNGVAGKKETIAGLYSQFKF